MGCSSAVHYIQGLPRITTFIYDLYYILIYVCRIGDIRNGCYITISIISILIYQFIVTTFECPSIRTLNSIHKVVVATRFNRNGSRNQVIVSAIHVRNRDISNRIIFPNFIDNIYHIRWYERSSLIISVDIGLNCH